MRIKQKINIIALGFVSIFTLVTLPVVAYAADESCGVETSIISCKDSSGRPTVNNSSKDIEKNGVWALLILALNILTAGVGIVAVGGIVYGSILYASAGDRSDQVKKAINVIMNVVIGIVAYVAMYAILQFLIPGGIFS